MPNLPNTQDFEAPIQYALQEDKILVYGCQTHVHVSPYDDFYYVGFDSFGSEDSLRHLIAKHLLVQLKADHSDSIINALSKGIENHFKLSECFNNDAALHHLDSHTFKQGETHDISVTQIFEMMTAMTDMPSRMANMSSVIVVSGCCVTNIKSMLGEDWKYDDAKYRRVMNDDATIVMRLMMIK